MEGLVDIEERDLTLEQAKELLARLRADPRFAEINTAVERRHEIPYGLPGASDLPSMGVIDLVYRVNEGEWNIVDFKTDDVRDDSEFEKVKGKYASQILRYREAFRRLLGRPAESWLCFLNHEAQIRWEKILPE